MENNNKKRLWNHSTLKNNIEKNMINMYKKFIKNIELKARHRVGL